MVKAASVHANVRFPKKRQRMPVDVQTVPKNALVEPNVIVAEYLAWAVAVPPSVHVRVSQNLMPVVPQWFKKRILFYQFFSSF